MKYLFGMLNVDMHHHDISQCFVIACQNGCVNIIEHIVKNTSNKIIDINNIDDMCGIFNCGCVNNQVNVMKYILKISTVGVDINKNDEDCFLMHVLIDI